MGTTKKGFLTSEIKVSVQGGVAKPRPEKKQFITIKMDVLFGFHTSRQKPTKVNRLFNGIAYFFLKNERRMVVWQTL